MSKSQIFLIIDYVFRWSLITNWEYRRRIRIKTSNLHGIQYLYFYCLIHHFIAIVMMICIMLQIFLISENSLSKKWWSRIWNIILDMILSFFILNLIEIKSILNFFIFENNFNEDLWYYLTVMTIMVLIEYFIRIIISLFSLLILILNFKKWKIHLYTRIMSYKSIHVKSLHW